MPVWSFRTRFGHPRLLIADEPEGEILTHSRTPLQASRQVADSDLILCQDFNAFSRTAGLETAPDLPCP